MRDTTDGIRLARAACEPLIVGMRGLEALIDDDRWPGGMHAVWPPVFDERRWCVPVGVFRGWQVHIMPMLYNDRLVLASAQDWCGYAHGWCYPKGLAAVAAVSWRISTDDHPPGFIKHATPGPFTTQTWAR